MRMRYVKSAGLVRRCTPRVAMVNLVLEVLLQALTSPLLGRHRRAVTGDAAAGTSRNDCADCADCTFAFTVHVCVAVRLPNHEAGQGRVGKSPCRREFGRPRRAETFFERPEQRRANSRVVHRLYPIANVTFREHTCRRQDRIELVEAVYNKGQRRHQFATLSGHVAAKQWLYFRRYFKQTVIEEGGSLVRDWNKPGEALLDEFDVRWCHLFAHFLPPL